MRLQAWKARFKSPESFSSYAEYEKTVVERASQLRDESLLKRLDNIDTRIKALVYTVNIEKIGPKLEQKLMEIYLESEDLKIVAITSNKISKSQRGANLIKENFANFSRNKKLVTLGQIASVEGDWIDDILSKYVDELPNIKQYIDYRRSLFGSVGTGSCSSLLKSSIKGLGKVD
ncbi:MAG: hypothetical protein KBD78_13820 [Oligoflexales bacterium]|nr:hypothetical protein [Oligoflexales bacterium]